MVLRALRGERHAQIPRVLSPGPVLVTGAGGFIGRAVVDQLLDQGYAVRRAVRRAGDLDPRCDTTVVGSIDARTAWDDALDGVGTVVHLAAHVHAARDPLAMFRAVNVDGTLRFARAAIAARVRRFVFASSLAVHAATGARALTPEDPPAPSTPYGESKAEAERALEELTHTCPLELVIVRPPMVYGPGNPGNMQRLLALVARRVPLPLGAVRNRRSMIYVTNLASAFVAIVAAPHARGIYLVRDEEDLATPDLVRRLAHALGVKPPLLAPLPPALVSALARLAGRGRDAQAVLESLHVDDSAFRRDFGWRAPIALDAGLAATADWYRLARIRT